MSEPIFKSIFGDAWHQLPEVMQKHYANHPFSNDINTVKGTLSVHCKAPLIWLGWLMKWLGQIPPFNQTHVPCTVQFESNPNDATFRFNRTFYFHNSQPYVFQSRMLQLHRNQVIEIMRFGFCWQMQYGWDGQKVILEHRGYGLYWFKRYLPLPLTWLLGKGYAEEHALSETEFEMITHITHPWWGNLYQYNGRFEVQD